VISKGDVECEGDASGQVEDGIFRKLLKIFGDWLDWVCGCTTSLGRISSFGLKRKLGSMGLGRIYKCVFSVLRGVRLQTGSGRMGHMPNIKKARKLGFVPDYGSNAFGSGCDPNSQHHRNTVKKNPNT
jgi:hypothetical protein